MRHRAIAADRARALADQVVNTDDHAAGFLAAEFLRLDPRIDQRPLATSINAPALHAVGPVDFGMEPHQHRLDVARVEAAMAVDQNSAIGNRHGRYHIDASAGREQDDVAMSNPAQGRERCAY